jgi:hypothetical protein
MADNIYKKMLQISAEVSRVAKNLNVGEGRNQYKAVGEADVLAAVKPIEEKYQVYSYPVSRQVIDSGEMINTNTYNGQTKETRKLYLRVETIYRFVNVENPNEYIDITTYGDGVDTQDKAPGKAMTYSDKYALLKAYKIQTGDDPDQTASEPLQGINRGKISPAKAKALTDMLTKANVNINALCEKFGVSSISDLTEEQHTHIVQMVKKSDGNNRKN